jgi:hypothetical protein
MSTYKKIKGTAVQSIDGEPDNPLKGQLWYDTVDAEFKYKEQVTGNAWSTANPMNTPRGSLPGVGTQTAALVFGGVDPGSGPGGLANAEEYDGTSWTEVGDLNTARRYLTGVGDQTAALGAGGTDPTRALTELWNGTSWTEVADLNTARDALGGSGISTAAVVFGGEPGPLGNTEIWNGSSWTEVNDLNTARSLIGSTSSGGSTAALGFGGNGPPEAVKNTESWNGTSWTDVADLNTGRRDLGGSGSQTAALAFGGADLTTTVANTESWNGTLWTETTDLNVAIRAGAATGTSSSALYARDANTEEWNAGVILGAWYTGGNLNTTRRGLTANSAGTQTAGMCIGGFIPPRLADTELYNGTSWSEVNNLNLARFGGAGVGVQTSALYFGGSSANPSPENPGFTRENKNESWNGASWTELADLNSGRSDLSGVGASNTEALCFGGKNPAVNPPGGLLALTEVWNGTSWTEVSDLNTQKEQAAGAGTATAALASGGASSTDILTQTESWNGTSWTEVNDLNTAQQGAGGAGTSTAALAFGGSIPSNTAITQEWNGTNWSNVNSMSTARTALGGLGSSTAALAFGGYIGPANTNETEEWDGTGFITRSITTTTE